MHKLAQKLPAHPATQSFLVFLVLAVALASAASPPTTKAAPKTIALDRQIDNILTENEAQHGSWGMEVVDLATEKVLYARDADHLFIPASNMKMFTTAAALEKLGPDYTFHTTVESDAAPDGEGRVWDLYLVGRGDPDLGPRIFPYAYHGAEQPPDTFIQELADKVKAGGVRRVMRKIVADDSYFVWEPFAPNWAANDLEWGYGAPVSALAFNDNLLVLHVKPGEKPGDEARVRLEPVADYYLLRNHIVTAEKGADRHYDLERRPGTMELDLWGQVPADAGEDIDTVAIYDPPELVTEQFRAALRARGIVADCPIEVHHSTRLQAASLPSPAPPEPARVVLADHTSPPLREAIKAVNKESENLHAEMLLRTLGRELNHRGSLSGGLAALNAFAQQDVGILPTETYFVDGSGLSRSALVAPSAAVKLLLHMARSPNFQAYFDSLPAAGVDGTLIHRFTSDEMMGRIHAKTGSVQHVSTLSGYMDLPSGKRMVFSVMTNNLYLRNHSGQSVLDLVTEAIYQWLEKNSTAH